MLIFVCGSRIRLVIDFLQIWKNNRNLRIAGVIHFHRKPLCVCLFLRKIIENCFIFQHSTKIWRNQHIILPLIFYLCDAGIRILCTAMFEILSLNIDRDYRNLLCNKVACTRTQRGDAYVSIIITGTACHKVIYMLSNLLLV